MSSGRMTYVPDEVWDEVNRMMKKFGLSRSAAFRKLVRNNNLISKYDLDIVDILEGKL